MDTCPGRRPGRITDWMPACAGMTIMATDQGSDQQESIRLESRWQWPVCHFSIRLHCINFYELCFSKFFVIGCFPHCLIIRTRIWRCIMKAATVFVISLLATLVAVNTPASAAASAHRTGGEYVQLAQKAGHSPLGLFYLEQALLHNTDKRSEEHTSE